MGKTSHYFSDTVSKYYHGGLQNNVAFKPSLTQSIGKVTVNGKEDTEGRIYRKQSITYTKYTGRYTTKLQTTKKTTIKKLTTTSRPTTTTTSTTTTTTSTTKSVTTDRALSAGFKIVCRMPQKLDVLKWGAHS